MREQLTRQDVEKIEKEIEYRKLVVRKNAIEAVKEARSHGDLSENFEYHAAKKDKNQNESRIRYLERMLKTARIVKDDAADDEVGLDKKVEVYFVDCFLCFTVCGTCLIPLVATDAVCKLINFSFLISCVETWLG